MARTPYDDPEAEKQYSDTNTGNKKLAGDIIDVSEHFKNIQQSNSISRTMPKNEPGYGSWPAGTSSWAEPSRPKVPVLRIPSWGLPKK